MRIRMVELDQFLVARLEAYQREGRRDLEDDESRFLGRKLPLVARRLVCSLAARVTEDAEIIVVNDGSRDGTPDLVREYKKKNLCLRLLENPGNRSRLPALQLASAAVD